MAEQPYPGGKAAASAWRGMLLTTPILGPLLRFLSALRNLTAFRAETRQRLELLEQRTAGLEVRVDALEPRSATLEARSATLETRATSLEKRTDALEPRSTTLEAHSAALETRSATLDARAASLENRTDALEPRSAALEAANTALAAHARSLETQAASLELRFTGQQQTTDNQRLDTSALQAYVTALHADMEALGGLTRQTAADQAALAQELSGREQTGSAGLPDKVFFELERHLAASRADLFSRHAIYLSHISDSARNLPVLDLGCGRGEWLAYLHDHGISAQGVDLSRDMVEKCLAQGLAATQGDGLTVLRKQTAASLRAVTALQVVERLSAGTLWQWLAAAWQALAPGGRLIIETLNPENLQVAAYTFHLDPQRLEPLPPPLLEFLLRAAGFDIVALLRHDPVPEVVGKEGSPALLGRGCDYAIVAMRPEHD